MSWIPRTTALTRLGVKPQTLYAYVSRGLVTARPDTHDPRASLYSAADIAALVKRRRSGRARESIARQAIAWGDPVMETRITTVKSGRLIYGGRDAIRMAHEATLEEVARWLWQAGDEALGPRAKTENESDAGAPAKQRIFVFLAQAASQGAPSFGRARTDLVAEAETLLTGFARAIAGEASRGAFHQRLGRYWRLSPAGMDLVRRALVLIADHELNPSTFSARVAASTGAPLAACALAGLSTLAGPLHGEASAKALRYLRAARETSAEAALSALGARGEAVPATGHALYPSGDPRAAALLRWMQPAPEVKRAIRAAERASGEAANIDMALAAMTLTLGLDDDAPFLLFASGRMAGWLAHAIEQAESGRAIRPRALYVGE